MNTNELAGSISRFVEQIKPTNNPSDDAVIQGLPEWFIEDLEKSATMLRQQQAEIEALKAKTLTDEEIETIYLKTLNKFDFARAILRKAQEK